MEFLLEDFVAINVLSIPDEHDFEIELVLNEDSEYLFTIFKVEEFDNIALTKLRNHLNDLIRSNDK
jgi:hypothetical protein